MFVFVSLIIYFHLGKGYDRKRGHGWNESHCATNSKTKDLAAKRAV